MSRIGKKPIEIPKGVEVTITDENEVHVKGPLGQLTQKIDPRIRIVREDNIIRLERDSEDKESRSLHGLYRALLHNMVTGVHQGFEIQQEVVGVGYKVEAKGQVLEMTLGHSHNIAFVMPPEVKVQTVIEKGKNPLIILKSHDKQLLGQVAAKIRSLRKPEPYKGKGIKFVGEQLRRKAGKSAAQK